MRWVQAVISSGGRVKEASYEVEGDSFDLSIRSGPTRGRQAEARQIFKDCIFILLQDRYVVVGEESATVADLKYLIGLGGGWALSYKEDFDFKNAASNLQWYILTDALSVEEDSG